MKKSKGSTESKKVAFDFSTITSFNEIAGMMEEYADKKAKEAFEAAQIMVCSTYGPAERKYETFESYKQQNP